MGNKKRAKAAADVYYESLLRAVDSPTPANIKAAGRRGLKLGYNSAVIAFTLWEMSTKGGLLPESRFAINQHAAEALIEEVAAALRGRA